MSLLLLLIGAKRGGGGGGGGLEPYAYEKVRREDDEILTLIMLSVESNLLEGEVP